MHLLSRVFHCAPWILAAAGMLLGLMVMTEQAVGQEDQDEREGTTGFWQEFHRPAKPYRGPQRNGRQVYDFRCRACHEKGTQGAPMMGDGYEWGRRTRQGIGVLLDHARNGYGKGLMPARGGCRDCSDEELRGAIKYMLEKSNTTTRPIPEGPAP